MLSAAEFHRAVHASVTVDQRGTRATYWGEIAGWQTSYMFIDPYHSCRATIFTPYGVFTTVLIPSSYKEITREPQWLTEVPPEIVLAKIKLYA